MSIVEEGAGNTEGEDFTAVLRVARRILSVPDACLELFASPIPSKFMAIRAMVRDGRLFTDGKRENLMLNLFAPYPLLPRAELIVPEKAMKNLRRALGIADQDIAGWWRSAEGRVVVVEGVWYLPLKARTQNLPLLRLNFDWQTCNLYLANEKGV